MKIRYLKQGDTGEDVQIMQALLRAAHFTASSGELLEIDGIYGAKTQEAVDDYHLISCMYAGERAANVNFGSGFSVSDWYNFLGIKYGDVD